VIPVFIKKLEIHGTADPPPRKSHVAMLRHSGRRKDSELDESQIDV